MASALLIFLISLKYISAENVRLGVLLPATGDLPFTYMKTQPAFSIALDFVNSQPNLLPSHALSVVYKDTKCSATEGPLQAIDLHTTGHIHGFIGPACDYALAPVARFSRRWGTPILTGGGLVSAFRDKTQYGLLTRVMGSYSKLAEFFLSVTETFNFNHIGLIYSTPEKRRNAGKSGCFFKMEAIYLAYMEKNVETWHAYFDSDDDNFDVDIILDEASTKTRVLVMCASPDHVRKIMLRAHDRIARENYVFFDLADFESDSETQQWYREEDTPENNEKARTAYEGLLTVTLRRPTSQEYRQFSNEVKRRGAQSHQNYTAGTTEVNSFVGAFHDAIILYALAVTEALEAGESVANGTAINQRMWNRTFQGITGTVSIDSNGDRDMDYSLLDMNPNTGKFEVVGNYYGAIKVYTPVPGKAIHWAGGRTEPPPDSPVCGFEGEKCPSGGTEPPNLRTRAPDNQESNPFFPTTGPVVDLGNGLGIDAVDETIIPIEREEGQEEGGDNHDYARNLQMEVMEEEVKKLRAETSFYELMVRKLKAEVGER